jgi:hypothetical protein
MTVRNLLVKTKLEAFLDWLKQQGEIIEKPIGYQVARFRLKGQEKPHFIYDNNRSVHLSFEERTAPVVRRFLRESKNGSKVTFKQFAVQVLREKGYDGLKSPSDDCYCLLDDLLRCGFSYCADCLPGKAACVGDGPEFYTTIESEEQNDRNI